MSLPKRIFIANRGEIAVRIMKTCRALGIVTVWPRVSEDKKSLASKFADVIVEIDEATDYLNGSKLISLAKEHHSEAIHPGYGYLSENLEFAQGVRKAGIIFIGPGDQALNVMGDKLSSRKAMIDAGVSVVPGTDEIKDPEEALKTVGLPVLLKPSGGGGGKGMVVVEKAEDLQTSLEACRRQAQKAFADDRVYMERWIPRARHVEVQIMADMHGDVRAYGTRDCTVQRRYQKVVEESPAPNISDELRKRFEQEAIQAARAVDYSGAGTVEFILTPEGEVFFLEMNTRLQVEHPVTELVWGVDLVEEQIRVASGEALLEKPSPRGHAFEARIYAEDPDQDFLPCTGDIHLMSLPNGPGVRIDSGVEAGSNIGIHFDPMILKISAWGRSREQARERLVKALEEFVLHGVGHNGRFLIDVLNSEEFCEFNIHTRWLEDQSFGKFEGPDSWHWLLVSQGQKMSSAQPRKGSGSQEIISSFVQGDPFELEGIS